MTLKDCKPGDKVWIHDPYSNMDSLVKIDGPFIENFREIGIKVCFADTMYLAWDILPFDEICWIK